MAKKRRVVHWGKAPAKARAAAPEWSKWTNHTVLRDMFDHPIYLQYASMSEGGAQVKYKYRGVYLVDTSLKVLEFDSKDRGVKVNETSDYDLINRAILTANVEFTRPIREAGQ